MGAWLTGAFDNDDASDWVYELEDGGIDAHRSRRSMTRFARPRPFEPPTDVNAIAAGRSRRGRERPSGAPGLRRGHRRARPTGLASSVTAEHVARARTAVERVLNASELAELWAETDDDGEWRGLVGDLIRRLSPDTGPPDPDAS